jgi:hypothetical protein
MPSAIETVLPGDFILVIFTGHDTAGAVLSAAPP